MFLKDCEQIRDIIALYIEDEENLFDEYRRYKSYAQIVMDFKGLVSARVIKKILKQQHPEIAKKLSTSHKAHQVFMWRGIAPEYAVVNSLDMQQDDASDSDVEELSEDTRVSIDYCTEQVYSRSVMA